MCKEVKLLGCIRIDGLSLGTGEYFRGSTEGVSEISSAFGYLLDAENQLVVLGKCLKTIGVVTGPAYSVVDKALRRERGGLLQLLASLLELKSQSRVSWEFARPEGHREGLQGHRALLLTTK